ncbi:MAG: SDR family oxidoreductase [Firmicutes bacterium]|nr:SDR family oxidoreductase [Bacillota bacterium]
MQTLQGRTCVFAGAAGLIGRGAVKALADGGMNVVMVTHSPDSAKEVAELCRDCPGKVVAMSNKEGDHAVFPEVMEQFGSVDVVINSTGSMSAPAYAADVDLAQVRKKLDHAADELWMRKEAIPYLEKSRAPSIIFTASAGAQNGFMEESIADSMANGALMSLTKVLARQLAPKGITVNCVARSGMIADHPYHEGSQDLDVKTIEPLVPLGRLGSADDYGALIAFLASEESSFVTGQILSLSGGLNI